jgi:ribonuclease BN (tRNA processing enzyme)
MGSAGMTVRLSGGALATVLVLASCNAPPPPPASAPASAPSSGGTQVVFLGTGTPLPDPDRSGPATAVVVNGSAYLFDAGAGVVRRATAAARKGITALGSVNLKTAFLTHLHSDHTMGLPDLILTPWTMGREAPLELHGPAGTRAMVDGIQQAWALDIDRRRNDLQPATPDGWRVNVHELQAGRPAQAYRDANVTVTAIPVQHGVWEAFGYRIDTADKSIVISGDARPTDALTAACQGCDLLIFEIYTMGSTEKVTAPWREYRRAYHTSTRELADIAAKSRPKLLVLYHRANPGCDQVGTNCGASGSEEEALAEMRRLYSGPVVEAHDLDVF